MLPIGATTARHASTRTKKKLSHSRTRTRPQNGLSILRTVTLCTSTFLSNKARGKVAFHPVGENGGNDFAGESISLEIFIAIQDHLSLRHFSSSCFRGSQYCRSFSFSSFSSSRSLCSISFSSDFSANSRSGLRDKTLLQ